MGKRRQKQSLNDLDIAQKLALPVDEVTEDPECQEAMDYLKSVREEAKLITACKVYTNELESDKEETLTTKVKDTKNNITDNQNSQGNCNYGDFEYLTNYHISENLSIIRKDPAYDICKSEIIEYILSQKEKVSTLTEALQTEEIISVSNWEEIIQSAQIPCITIGKWNSYNWSNLLEYFANKFDESALDSFLLDTNKIQWVILALISVHTIDSYNPHVSFCMQRIKRYLESNDFSHLSKDDHFRIETIIIIIKYIYNQF
ncbi:unnamed protein product [Cryptosporidium hominis]|uniref:Gem-associated protein 2 n=1 Tax=Cryptosporidium hominis TaxID=237895 RepID=A0A0S4TGA6_CRYHO|nr:hypothetical protein ChTU502y2012_406g0165 [Cryptosporidium hominis]PPA64751.1 hypothetical protein ChUKH1_01725 [Cryptosporidium hominis]CUV06512.1 unnamed protein product [Cryptosporidium hominis]